MKLTTIAVNIIASLFIGSVIFGLCVAVLYALNKLNTPVITQTEIEYKSECSKVHGNAVWNGKYWECLK